MNTPFGRESKAHSFWVRLFYDMTHPSALSRFGFFLLCRSVHCDAFAVAVVSGAFRFQYAGALRGAAAGGIAVVCGA